MLQVDLTIQPIIFLTHLYFLIQYVIFLTRIVLISHVRLVIGSDVGVYDGDGLLIVVKVL